MSARRLFTIALVLAMPATALAQEPAPSSPPSPPPASPAPSGNDAPPAGGNEAPPPPANGDASASSGANANNNANASADGNANADSNASPNASNDAPAPPAEGNASAEPAAPREPVEVRVIGSRPDALQRIPGSGTVITSQDMKRADPYSPEEMLRRVPGVQVRQDGESGNRLDIGIRGLDGGRSRRVLVLEDGIPIAVNPYGEPDLLYAPPIERMRGIEVVKGSGSILFGPQTIGGVVNFFTIAPEPREHLMLDAEGGQRGYARGIAQYGNTLGSARYVTQAFFKRGNGFRDQAFQAADVFGKIAFDTSKKGEATLKLGFHDEDAYADDVGLTRAMYAANPRQPTLAPNDRMHQRRYEASVVQEQRFSPETKLRTLVYAYTTQRTWRRQKFLRTPFDPTAQGAPSFDYFVGDPSLPGGGIYFLNNDTIQDQRYEVAGFEPRLEHRMRTGSVGHTIDLGGRLLGETAHYQQRTGDLPDSDSGANDSEEKHRTIAVAAYLQDRVELLDKLLVTPGVRFEHAEFHRIVLRQADKDVNQPGDFGVSGFIPGAGMIYGTRDAHVFAGVHVGWAPPRFAASFSPNGTPSQVDAEHSYNYELGTRVFYNKWIRGEVTGFYSRFTNQVITGTGNGGGSDGGASLVNGGATQHAGAEGGATLMIGKALRWPTFVDLGARYTFARATFLEGTYAGNLLPYAPLHSVNANLDIDHRLGDGSFVGGQVAYAHVSSQFADSADTLKEDATGQYGLIPAHNIVDVTAHYRHKPSGLSLRLTVKNALDDVYIAGRRPQGISVAGFRQVMLGLRWDWEAKDKSDAEGDR
jgi:Fe(3+) dicitrate transport protein